MMDDRISYKKSLLKKIALVKTQLIALVRWNILRHKYLLLVSSLTQIFLCLVIFYGIQSGEINIASEVLTITIVAVGILLPVRMLSTDEQRGIIKYQMILSTHRVVPLISNLLFLGLVVLSGIVINYLLFYFLLEMTISSSLQALLVLLITQLCMICVGFATAYLISTNSVRYLIQTFIIASLLVSPILYPIDRLPQIVRIIYQNLPFTPIYQLIRGQLLDHGASSLHDWIVVVLWGFICFGFSFYKLQRRD